MSSEENNGLQTDYFLSIGLPGTVWQDWGLYIRPPIKDSVKKSCPGWVKPQSFPDHDIAPWATGNCTEVLEVWGSSLSIYCWCVCERELLLENSEEKAAGYRLQLSCIVWVKNRWVLLYFLPQSHGERFSGALICVNMNIPLNAIQK